MNIPEQKAQQIFDDCEKWLLTRDNWITVARVKDRANMEIEKILNTYRNARDFNNEENQKRIDYWLAVRTHINKL